jgi:hypothetical protein
MLGAEVRKNLIAPRRQARKEKYLLVSPNLACFASLRESSSSALLFDSEFQLLFVSFWSGAQCAIDQTILELSYGGPA